MRGFYSLPPTFANFVASVVSHSLNTVVCVLFALRLGRVAFPPTKRTHASYRQLHHTFGNHIPLLPTPRHGNKVYINAVLITYHDATERSHTTGTLCAIRKPVFKKGDRKFMTLLPSFNGKETRTGEEIPTSQDYLITGVKRLRFTSPKFSITGEGVPSKAKRQHQPLNTFAYIWTRM